MHIKPLKLSPCHLFENDWSRYDRIREKFLVPAITADDMDMIARVNKVLNRMLSYMGTYDRLTALSDALPWCGYVTVVMARDGRGPIKVTHHRWNSPLDAMEHFDNYPHFVPIQPGNELYNLLDRIDMLPHSGEFVELYYSPVTGDCHLVTR